MKYDQGCLDGFFAKHREVMKNNDEHRRLEEEFSTFKQDKKYFQSFYIINLTSRYIFAEIDLLFVSVQM